jgi:polar amino acid transport system substrate-binding protein
MKMTLRCLRAILVATAIVSVSGAAFADLRLGVAAEPYPPYTVKDASGTWAGWEIDAMNAVCEELKEKCNLVEVAWDGIIPALTSKQIDVIWSSMAITEARKQTIDFSISYYSTADVIIGAKNGDKDISPEHLKGKVVGVQVSTIHERYMQKYYVPSGVELKSYATQDEANSDLAAGRLDYVQADATALDAFLRTEQGVLCCELKGQVKDDTEILGEGVGAGVRKEDTALRERLNVAIAALGRAGKFDEITARYPELVGKLVLPK